VENNTAVDFDLRYIFKTILSKWYIVIIMIILSLGFAFYKGYHKTTTVYEVKTSLTVGNPVDGANDIDKVALYERYIQIYCALARNNYIAEKVSDRLNNRISPEVIQSSIIVSPMENTQFINIRMVWGSPEQAKETLKTFNEVFIDEAKKFYPACAIQVLGEVKDPKPMVISRKKYLMAAPFAGIVLAILITFGIDFLDNTIKTEEDIRQYLNISVLGEIPRQKKLKDKISVDYIRNLKPSMIEAFRTVRTNIEFISSCNNLKSVMITSGRPEEGKTLTASVLSAVLAQSGKRTILLDCDLRNPNVHKNFKISNDIGLSNYLAGRVMLGEAVHKTTIDNLFVLPSGVKPPNPAELLGSPNMKALIRLLRNDYDYIVFDTPPVGLVTDAQVVSQISDGCVLVAASGSSVVKDTVKARDLLKNVGGKLVGVVLNKVKDSKFNKSYSYYYSGSINNPKEINA
jgi:capsular exopolysaccharide synthesis family protein